MGSMTEELPVPTAELEGLVRMARAPAYGAAVWGWGLWTGLALWAFGFYLLPWWAALLLWWWPSMLVGGVAGLLAVRVASLRRRRRGAPDLDPESLDRSADVWLIPLRRLNREILE
jgi:hypothetical protein